MFYVVKRPLVAILESCSFCKIPSNVISFKTLPIKGKISLKNWAVMIQGARLLWEDIEKKIFLWEDVGGRWKKKFLWEDVGGH